MIWATLWILQFLTYSNSLQFNRSIYSAPHGERALHATDCHLATSGYLEEAGEAMAPAKKFVFIHISVVQKDWWSE